MRKALALIVALLVLAGGAAAIEPAAAGADVVWLCRPGVAPDPCVGDQTTTVVSSAGARHVVTPRVVAKPRIDCFYVYPTVSEQPAKNANKDKDASLTAIARFQAQRFSQRCRMYAPVYRQATLAGLAVPPLRTPESLRLAYGDVREAWLSYLRHDNKGRGVVLIGHSQGSRMLRTLIRREIDAKPSVRRLIVSAILPGANVKVLRGRRIGGDFRHIPACASSRRTGCVVAWSTFNATPPSNSRFGRSDETAPDPLGGPVGPKYRVLCTNPADLTRNRATPLRTVLRTDAYPGIIGALLIAMFGGPPPSADTPWIEPQDHYRGRCVTEAGADVLHIAPIAGARTLHPEPDASWGLHLADVNIVLGNLVSMVHDQERAWLRAHPARRT